MHHSFRASTLLAAMLMTATALPPARALGAQPPARPDTLGAHRRARTDSLGAHRDTLEAVIVKALRASSASPASQYTVGRDAISKTFAGQDAPLFLTNAPSITSYSDAGGFSGYSYVRLRGIDQTRLNITLDGVPLNDPEDQVLYFSNVPDFLGSVESVQIQRGVGASTFGTAAFGGSMNFQSVPLGATPRGGAVELTGGSFNTLRGSARYSSGIINGHWAAHARVSKQHTDGYRRHSGNDSQSAFVSGAWFGDRDALKFTGFAGVSGTREAYLATAEADLALDRRVNPLSEAEGDRFHQEMANVRYARRLADGATLTLTGYRNSAAGAFDVNVGNAPGGGGPVIDNFYLAHVWYGIISALSLKRGAASLDAGVHASDYHREHAMAVRPLLTEREYTNVGFKQEQSGFAKFGYDAGAFRLSADVQVRRAAFRYQPSAGSGVSPASVSWTFVNPKAGLSWRAPGRGGPLSLFVAYGRTVREPSRGDLFAGADDLNAGNAASILPLTRVHPESVNDLEAGAAWDGARFSLHTNAFTMEFRNEIAPIGELSLTGSSLRQNVGESYRRGLELDGTWRVSERVTASANLTLMRARIASFRDASAARTYTNVEPLLTPGVIANQHVEVRLTGALSVIASGRYVGRSSLANDGDARFTLPAAWLVDGAVAWRRRTLELRAQLYNALDANAYAGGYHDGVTRYFYPVAARNVLVTTRFEF